MATVTLSLPQQIIKKIDIEAKKKGFSTRSEYVRNILRSHFTADVKEEKLDFKPFVKKPLEEIEADLRNTGLYNEKFIKSVIRGLRENSSFYADKTFKS